METLERAGNEKAQLNVSKSIIKLPGSIAQPPLLSNMKYHPGHTFGKSEINSRRATVAVASTDRNRQMFASTLSKAVSQESFGNFKNSFVQPPKEPPKKLNPKHSSSVSEFNFKKTNANLNETAENIRCKRK
jgi:hypothetical protein